MRRTAIIAFGLLATCTCVVAKKESALPAAATKSKVLSLVRVNVTGQAYDYFRPWQKRAPFSKRALGAVRSEGVGPARGSDQIQSAFTRSRECDRAGL